MRTFTDAEAVLAQRLPGYQSREPQQVLAAAIGRSINDGDHLIAEAGTGTGKSLAYLIESILSGQRVVISTATKALQDQLSTKDLPFLEEHLPVEFSWAVLKGRSNYLCPERALMSEGVTDLRSIIEFADEAGEDFSGERDEFPFPISDHDWREVCGDADTCGDLRCRDGARCYAQRAKIRASNANIVVVNHALFFADLKLKVMTDGYANVIGGYDVVVFDECHEVEEYATRSLSDRLTEGAFTATFARLRAFAGQHDFLDAIDPTLTDANAALIDLWQILTPGRIKANAMVANEDRWAALAEAMVGLSTAVDTWWQANKRNFMPGPEVNRAKRVVREVQNLATRYLEFIGADWSKMVRFCAEERRTRHGRQVSVKVLQMVPINVSDHLRGWLFDDDDITAVLVSATVEVNGSMDYIASRLGIDSHVDLNVGTPFDYTTQARLYVPTDLPEPNMANRAAWSNLMRGTLHDLLTHSQGRALVLFTSYREMDAAYSSLAPRLPYTCLRQGGGISNRDLVTQFSEDTHSVLFATRSFFTGVDFQGSTCSLVVIDKMPFPVPTDPLVEARQEDIERRGGSAFRDYAIPEMTLPLKQGFGRLIRHSEDFGVVAVLDPRLVTKGYGKGILRSFPPAPVVTDMDEVEAFFVQMRQAAPVA